MEGFAFDFCGSGKLWELSLSASPGLAPLPALTLPLTLRGADPATLPSITTFLLARLLTEARPGMLVLHGNALERGGRLLLLLGQSGAGKSTLTQRILEEHPGWRQVSEDLLLVDAGRGLLYPFPRAAALIPGDTARDEGGLARWLPPEHEDAGGEGRTKLLAAAPAPVIEESFPFENAAVVFLEKASGNGEWGIGKEGTAEFVTYVSLLPEGLEGALQEAGLPLESARAARGGVGVLRYTRALTAEESQREDAAALEAGALVLYSGGVAGTAALRGATGFPPAPAIEAITAGEASLAALPHLRRYRPAEEVPARTLMRLAGLMARARTCRRLFPGGTPSETIALLSDLLTR